MTTQQMNKARYNCTLKLENLNMRFVFHIPDGYNHNRAGYHVILSRDNHPDDVQIITGIAPVHGAYIRHRGSDVRPIWSVLSHLLQEIEKLGKDTTRKDTYAATGLMHTFRDTVNALSLN